MKNILIALVLVLIVAGAYVERHQIKTMLMGATPAPTEMTAQPSTSPEMMAGSSGASASSRTAAIKEISVTGNEFLFTPKNIGVSKGDTVKIMFTNTGKYPHNFTISDLNVQTKTVSPGQSDTVTFTADKAGTFTYMCTVPGHADKGMTGTLTVE